MKVDVLLGLQWGDEGKGKIVDVLTPGYDVVARFQGGPNAGHTIEFDGKKYVLHTIPSGIFCKDTINLIGNGVIIDPLIFSREVEKLMQSGIDISNNLYISRKAHLILPSHRMLDAVYEQAKGAAKIGSTLKGIGPAYTDKTGRNGLRVGDICMPDFEVRYAQLRDKHQALAAANGANFEQHMIDGLTFDAYEKKWKESLALLNQFQHVDSEYFINRMIHQNKRILAEGAQGSMLDIDFGSYPFVTSSNTTIAGVCSGLGIPPSKIGKVIGIFKAYCTRVGSGPFPTELFDDIGTLMRERGREFGSTTGRARRCGWLDMVALNYAIMLNGVTELIMMKADVLDVLDDIKVATAYKHNGVEIDYVPFEACTQDVIPMYEVLAGWKSELDAIGNDGKLPDAFVSYVNYIEQRTGVQVSIVSTGPDRTQTIYR